MGIIDVNFFKKGVVIVTLMVLLMPSPVTNIYGQQNDITKTLELNGYLPILNYSSYFGGSEEDSGLDITQIPDGGYFICGSTQSNDLPIKNPFNATLSGDYDIFVAKFAENNSLLWSTYLGGGSSELFATIMVTKDHGCIVAGNTYSEDFPTRNTTSFIYNGGSDIFLTRFSANGSCLWSALFGGGKSDMVKSITPTDDEGFFITGYTSSSSFPTKFAFDITLNGFSDAFVSRFTANCSLLWSTFLGGNDNDNANKVIICGDNNCLIVGNTRSIDFPTMEAFDENLNGESDMFITKFSANGNLLWSSYIGGNEREIGTSIGIDAQGNLYCAGNCIDFTRNQIPYSQSEVDNNYGFICKFSNNLEFLWQFYLNGNAKEFVENLVVNSSGFCTVVGYTHSVNFPVKNAYYNQLNGYSDAFITQFDPQGSIVWSTYLGGTGEENSYDIDYYADGNYILIGETSSDDFPVSKDRQYNYSDVGDAFITIISEKESPNLPISLNNSLYFLWLFPTILLIFIRRKKSH